MNPVPTPAHRGLTVGLLLCVTAVAFETQAVLTAMPAAARDLGDLQWYAWAFTAVMIAQIVALAVAGRLCDSVGPVPPLIGGLVLFGVGVVISALAPTMLVLLGGRFVQGLGAGGVNVTLMVIAGQAYPPDRRAVLMTWFSGAWMLPSFLGPAIAAWLTVNLSWHWVFWSVLPFVALGALFMVPGLSRMRPPAVAAPDADPWRIPAAVGAAAGVTMLQLAGQQLDAWSLAWALGAVVTLALSFRRLMPRGFSLAAGGLSAVLLVRLVTAGSFFGAQSFLPLMLVQSTLPAIGVPSEDASLIAGAAITIASVGWMTGSWLQSRRWLRLSRDRIIVVGAACVAGGLAIAALGAWTPTLGVWFAVGGFTVAGLGMGLQSASTSLAVMQLSAPAELGRDTSSLQVGEMLGNALLTGIAGTIFAALATPDPGAVFGWILAALAASGTVAVAIAARIGHVDNHSLAS